MSKIEKEDNDLLVFAPKTEQYTKSSLDIKDVESDPIVQFKTWFDEAIAEKERQPDVVNLATASLPSGRVSNRTVLFKELDKRGFIIFSNWRDSKKAKDIQSNPHAAITFFWRDLQRQVRIEGITERLTNEQSQIYFNVRPRGSRIGAWSSPQSQKIQNREELDELYKANEEKFKGIEDIPVPDFWGGVRVVPLEIEFWQGRSSRLHDRVVFKREAEDKEWEVYIIAP